VRGRRLGVEQSEPTGAPHDGSPRSSIGWRGSGVSRRCGTTIWRLRASIATPASTTTPPVPDGVTPGPQTTPSRAGGECRSGARGGRRTVPPQDPAPSAAGPRRTSAVAAPPASELVSDSRGAARARAQALALSAPPRAAFGWERRSVDSVCLTPPAPRHPGHAPRAQHQPPWRRSPLGCASRSPAIPDSMTRGSARPTSSPTPSSGVLATAGSAHDSGAPQLVPHAAGPRGGPRPADRGRRQPARAPPRRDRVP
jgi:hypothetical protein